MNNYPPNVTGNEAHFTGTGFEDEIGDMDRKGLLEYLSNGTPEDLARWTEDYAETDDDTLAEMVHQAMIDNETDPRDDRDDDYYD
mgnify:CR=1 FL=1